MRKESIEALEQALLAREGAIPYVTVEVTGRDGTGNYVREYVRVPNDGSSAVSKTAFRSCERIPVDIPEKDVKKVYP